MYGCFVKNGIQFIGFQVRVFTLYIKRNVNIFVEYCIIKVHFIIEAIHFPQNSLRKQV